MSFWTILAAIGGVCVSPVQKPVLSVTPPITAASFQGTDPSQKSSKRTPVNSNTGRTLYCIRSGASSTLLLGDQTALHANVSKAAEEAQGATLLWWTFKTTTAIISYP